MSESTSRAISHPAKVGAPLRRPGWAAMREAASEAAGEGIATLARACPFWVKMLILSLMVPSALSLQVGSLRLSAYRIVLLLAFVPALRAITSGKAGRICLPDLLIGFHLLWASVVFWYHHGGGVAIESGGIRFVEFGGAYLVTRAFVTDRKTFMSFAALVICAVCLLAPLTLFEAVTGKNPISELIGGNYNRVDIRLGLQRSSGPFEHPILYGLFASSALGLFWFLRPPASGGSYARNKLQTFLIFLATFTSLSSGALMSLIVQCGLIAWEKITTGMQGRWRILSAVIIFAYVAIDLFSTRTPMRVFLTYLTFSSHTAYYRLITFNTAIDDVWNNPLFGIGNNDWTRPAWMFTRSMDNFWLLQAVTFGIPGFLSLAAATVLLLIRPMKVYEAHVHGLRFGWTIATIALVFSATTVHLWNAMFCYFALLVGAGVWFSNPPASLQRSNVGRSVNKPTTPAQTG